MPCFISHGMAGRLRTAANRVRGIAHSMPGLLPCRLDIVLELVGTRSQARMCQRAEGGQHERNDQSSRLHLSNLRFLMPLAGSRPVRGGFAFAAAPSENRLHTLRGGAFPQACILSLPETGRPNSGSTSCVTARRALSGQPRPAL